MFAVSLERRKGGEVAVGERCARHPAAFSSASLPLSCLLLFPRTVAELLLCAGPYAGSETTGMKPTQSLIPTDRKMNLVCLVANSTEHSISSTATEGSPGGCWGGHNSDLTW